MLSVRYVLAYSVRMQDGTVVGLSEELPLLFMEERGRIINYCFPGVFTPEAVDALNVTVAQSLSGKQWFQLWRGEIISMESPDTEGESDGRLHRGPLVDQTTGPRNGEEA